MRIGQMQALMQVIAAPESAETEIWQQLKRRLRSRCGCELVPVIRETLSDYLVLNYFSTAP